MDNFYIHHVLHSLAIAAFIDLKKGSQIIDLGCGGGFPGIPLAIFFPEVKFTLIDSTAKKIKVVQAVSLALGLTNITAIHTRAEEYKGERADFVVSRAVAEAGLLSHWSRRLVHEHHKNAIPNGLIALKGGDLKNELKTLPRGLTAEKYAISDYFSEPYFEEKYLVYIPF
jgi:16S rRNA (guanine527-N7)-methyltransferase